MYERTALILASHNGNLAVVNALLAAGANVNHQDKNGYTALMSASDNGNLAVVNDLLAAGANVNHQDENGNTALMSASLNGNLAVVNALLANKANVDHQNNKLISALMRASRRGHLDVVKKLLDSGANVDLQDADGKTALMWASEEGHLEIVKNLLAYGAVPDQVAKKGWTALMYASMNGHLDVIKTLMHDGANMLFEIDGKTIKDIIYNHEKKNYRKWPTANHLIDVNIGKNLINASKNNNITNLNDLFYNDKKETTMMDMDYQDPDGKTALMWAIENDRLNVVKLLIKHASDQLAKKIHDEIIRLVNSERNRKLLPNINQSLATKLIWEREKERGLRDNPGSRHMTLLAFAARLSLINVDKLELILPTPTQLFEQIDKKINEIKGGWY